MIMIRGKWLFKQDDELDFVSDNNDSNNQGEGLEFFISNRDKSNLLQ